MELFFLKENIMELGSDLKVHFVGHSLLIT